jgi:hypothetical protein
MSNDKQTKLYTEEEIVNFLKKEFEDEINAETFMENLTPIELPSDEEIYINANVNSENTEQHIGFIKGIQHMRELIEGNSDGN